MNREILQKISRLRRKEAYILLKAKCYQGAYYLIGYAIECALKACIAKQTKRYDFPDKQLANSVHTHNLEKLLKFSGLAPELEKEMKTNKALEVNWATVKDWKETSRYDKTISRTLARDLYAACTARKNGILSWIKKRW